MKTLPELFILLGITIFVIIYRKNNGEGNVYENIVNTVIWQKKYI